MTLQEVGASMADVVRVTVWLGNLDYFQAFNEEYCKHLSALTLRFDSFVLMPDR